MADPSCLDALWKIKQGAMSWVTYSNRALTHTNDALAHWNILEDHLAIEDIISAIRDMRLMGDEWGGWIPYQNEGPIWYYLNHCVAGVTMEAILSVMVAATDDEYKYFIGLIDAYRVGLWNKPFNAEYFAALARGFSG